MLHQSCPEAALTELFLFSLSVSSFLKKTNKKTQNTIEAYMVSHKKCSIMWNLNFSPVSRLQRNAVDKTYLLFN